VRNNEIQVIRDANQRARARLEPAEVEAIESALEPLRARLRAAPITLRRAAPAA
jgi:hypothetical protein